MLLRFSGADMLFRHFTAAAGLAALVTTSPAFASVFDTSVMGTPGLLAYFPFTPASQANSTVNGYTGTLVNGATIGGPGSGPPVADPNSSALVLANGASGMAYATAGGQNPLRGGIDQEGTIISWINLSSLPSTTSRIYSIAGESAVGNDFDLQVEGNAVRFYTDGGSATVSPTLTAADVDKWIFVAATFVANGSRNIYFDGTLVASGLAGSHTANNASFYEGQSNVFGNRYFDGSLSDIGVFNRALTANEIASLYASSFVSVGTVPLPASAPLFGAALLVLGGVGYGARRRKAAAA